MDLEEKDYKENSEEIVNAWLSIWEQVYGHYEDSWDIIDEYAFELETIYNDALHEEQKALDSFSFIVQQLLKGIWHMAVPPGVGKGAGSHNFSFDEFRFWKKARTHKEVGRHWFTQYGGGVNSKDVKLVDPGNVDLGVYYKFNEGVLDEQNIDHRDATIFDYSGRVSNGEVVNYYTGTRNLGSAINEANNEMAWVGTRYTEFKDPILYPDHPDVEALRAEKKLLGSGHDSVNNTAIYHTMPEWITDEDNGNLLNLTQVVSNYFDQLHLQIEELPRIKDVTYDTIEEGGDAPYHFAKDLLTSMGFVTPDIFVDATILEEIASRGEDEIFDHNLQKIKNIIYQNIYNNLVYIYKSKGTEKSFRNLIRCFGIDDELIKLNLYADEVTYKFEDNVRYTSVQKNYADFNDPDRFDSVVWQGTETTVDFIPGIDNIPSAPAEARKIIPATMQCEVIFPRFAAPDHPSYFPRTFGYTGAPDTAESSIMGIYEVDNSGLHTGLAGEIRLFAQRVGRDEKAAFFILEAAGSRIESPVFKDVYDNESWNFAVRLRVEDKYWDGGDAPVDLAVEDAALLEPTYVLELYGVRTTLDEVEDEFLISMGVEYRWAQEFFNHNQRMYVGASYEEFETDSTQRDLRCESDVKVSSVRYWLDYIDDDTVKAHAMDADSHGRMNPMKPAYFTQMSLVEDMSAGLGLPAWAQPIPHGIHLPQIKTLLLDWDFETVETADGGGGNPTVSDAGFDVPDVSHGLEEAAERYGWIGELAEHQYVGRGFFYLPNDIQAVDRDYVYSAKKQLPESLSSSNTVNILRQDDDLFPKNARPINHFWAIEKSMYQTISEEMIKMFASVKEFNNLVGMPVNRYRQDYKELGKLRQLFFEKVENTPSLERFVEFYKWIDSSLNIMLQQLIPASANFSDSMRTMVESHVLERNKYWTKFPTLEMNQDPPEGTIRGINELLYDWGEGFAPLEGTGFLAEQNNPLWWSERADRVESVTTGNTELDELREKIRKIVIREVKGQTELIQVGGEWVESDQRHYNQSSGEMYEGSTYAVRRLSRPYRFTGAVTEPIHGGTNYPSKKKSVELMRSLTHFGSEDGLKESCPLLVEKFAEIPEGAFNVELGSYTNCWLQNPEARGTIERQLGGENYTAYTFRGGANTGDPSPEPRWLQYAKPLQGPVRVDYSFAQGEFEEGSSPGMDLNKPEDAQSEDLYFQVSVDGGVSWETVKTHEANNSNQGNAIGWQSASILVENESLVHVRWLQTDFADTDPDYDNWAVTNIRITDASHEFRTTELRDSAVGTLKAPEGSYLNKLWSSIAAPYSLYSDHQHSPVTVTNHHSDAYGQDNETPMQGPFTSAHVGGSQHRHVELNLDGQDDISSRPELFLYEESQSAFVTPDKIDVDYPRAPFFRDETAKRPLNIQNIQTSVETPVHGNFRHIYEVVQTTGRDANNRWFVKNQGVRIETSANGAVADMLDYKLPDRSKVHRWGTKSLGVYDPEGTITGWGDPTHPDYVILNDASDPGYIGPYTVNGGWFTLDSTQYDDWKDEWDGEILEGFAGDAKYNGFGPTKHIITSIFSAPGSPADRGRGTRDLETEEYTPYNNLNYRNALVRWHMNYWSKDHCRFGGMRNWYIHDSAPDEVSDYDYPNDSLNPGEFFPAAWHKTNRNAAHQPWVNNQNLEIGGSILNPYTNENSLTCNTQYDNYFVQHPIPRSDWQYSWINASTDAREYKWDDGTGADPLPSASCKIAGYVSEFPNLTISQKELVPKTRAHGYIKLSSVPPDGTYNIEITDSAGAQTTVSFVVAGEDIAALANVVANAINTASEVLASVDADNVNIEASAYGETGNSITIEVDPTIPTTVISFHGGALNRLYGGRNLFYRDTNTLEFSLGSEVDYAGTNIRIYEPNTATSHEPYKGLMWETSVQENNVGWLNMNSYGKTSTIEDKFILNSIISHRDGAWAGSTWKQIRNYRNPIVRKHRRHNIISVQNKAQFAPTHLEPQNKNSRYTINTDLCTRYREPAVAWNKPMQHRLNLAGSVRGTRLQHSYSNNLEGYANPYLTNRTGYVKDGEQLYDRLVESYRDGKVSPAPEFVALRYREYIFPKHRWVGLKEVRERIHYFETNRELQVFRAGDLRTVWKDASHKRIRPMSSINSLGYRLTLNQHLYYEQSDSVWVMDDYSFQPVNDETGKLLYTDDGKAVWWSVLGDLAYVGKKRYWSWISSHTDVVAHYEIGMYGRFANNVLQDYTHQDFRQQMGEIIKDSPGGMGFRDIQKLNNDFNEGSFTHEDAINRYKSGQTEHDAYLRGEGVYNDQVKPQPSNRFGSSKADTQFVVDDKKARDPKSTFVIEGYGNDIGWTGVIDEERFNPGIIEWDDRWGRTPTPERDPDDVGDPPDFEFPPTIETLGPTLLDPGTEEPRPQLQYLYNPLGPEGTEYAEDGWSWNTGKLSGINPWYDDYKQYSFNDVRLIGQNYGLLPEYRVSEHMEYYVNQNGGNFRARNTNLLTLEGASFDGRTIVGSGEYDQESEKNFTHDYGGSWIDLPPQKNFYYPFSELITPSAKTLLPKVWQGAEYKNLQMKDSSDESVSRYCGRNYGWMLSSAEAYDIREDESNRPIYFVDIENSVLGTDLSPPWITNLSSTNDFLGQALFPDSFPDAVMKFKSASGRVEDLQSIEVPIQDLGINPTESLVDDGYKTLSMAFAKYNSADPTSPQGLANSDKPNPFAVSMWVRVPDTKETRPDLLGDNPQIGLFSMRNPLADNNGDDAGFTVGSVMGLYMTPLFDPDGDPTGEYTLTYYDDTSPIHANSGLNQPFDWSSIDPHYTMGTTQDFLWNCIGWDTPYSYINEVIGAARGKQNVFTFYQKDSASLEGPLVVGQNCFPFGLSGYKKDLPPQLNDDQWHHIVFQYIPPSISEDESVKTYACVRIFLDGKLMVGRHISDQRSPRHLVKIGEWDDSSGIWDAGDDPATRNVYGVSHFKNGPKNLSIMTIGAGCPRVSLKKMPQNSCHPFLGWMNDVSLYHGILTTEDVNGAKYSIYNSQLGLPGKPNNIVDLVKQNDFNSLFEDNNTTIDAEAWKADFAGGVSADGIPLHPEEYNNIILPKPEGLVTYLDGVEEAQCNWLDASLFSLVGWYRMGVPYLYERVGTSLQWNEDFFKVYSHTDFIKHFDLVIQDHEDLDGDMKPRLSLKVDAVKKLLPYNGFYPSQRSIQLGSLYVDCWGKHVVGECDIHHAQVIQSMLQPFFAPGILYNTIKSGIATDWAAFNNQAGDEPCQAQPFSVGKIILENKINPMPWREAIRPFEDFSDVSVTGGEKSNVRIYDWHPELDNPLSGGDISSDPIQHAVSCRGDYVNYKKNWEFLFNKESSGGTKNATGGRGHYHPTIANNYYPRGIILSDGEETLEFQFHTSASINSRTSFKMGSSRPYVPINWTHETKTFESSAGITPFGVSGPPTWHPTVAMKPSSDWYEAWVFLLDQFPFLWSFDPISLMPVMTRGWLTGTVGHDQLIFDYVTHSPDYGYTYHNPCGVRVPVFQDGSYAAYKNTGVSFGGYFSTLKDRPYPVLATGEMGWSQHATTGESLKSGQAVSRIPPHLEGDGGSGPYTQYGEGAPSDGGYSSGVTKQNGLAVDGLVFIPPKELVRDWHILNYPLDSASPAQTGYTFDTREDLTFSQRDRLWGQTKWFNWTDWQTAIPGGALGGGGGSDSNNWNGETNWFPCMAGWHYPESVHAPYPLNFNPWAHVYVVPPELMDKVGKGEIWTQEEVDSLEHYEGEGTWVNYLIDRIWGLKAVDTDGSGSPNAYEVALVNNPWFDPKNAGRTDGGTAGKPYFTNPNNNGMDWLTGDMMGGFPQTYSGWLRGVGGSMLPVVDALYDEEDAWGTGPMFHIDWKKHDFGWRYRFRKDYKKDYTIGSPDDAAEPLEVQDGLATLQDWDFRCPAISYSGEYVPPFIDYVENYAPRRWKQTAIEEGPPTLHPVVFVDVENGFGTETPATEYEIMQRLASKINDINSNPGGWGLTRWTLIAEAETDGVRGIVNLTNTDPLQASKPATELSPILMVDNYSGQKGNSHLLNLELGYPANHLEDSVGDYSPNSPPSGIDPLLDDGGPLPQDWETTGTYGVYEAFIVDGMLPGEKYSPSWMAWDCQPKNKNNNAAEALSTDVDPPPVSIPDSAGMVICESPYMRIPFEGILHPEAVFPPSGSLERNADAESIRKRITGAEARLTVMNPMQICGNTIVLTDPYGNEQKIKIGHKEMPVNTMSNAILAGPSWMKDILKSTVVQNNPDGIPDIPVVIGEEDSDIYFDFKNVNRNHKDSLTSAHVLNALKEYINRSLKSWNIEGQELSQSKWKAHILVGKQGWTHGEFNLYGKLSGDAWKIDSFHDFTNTAGHPESEFRKIMSHRLAPKYYLRIFYDDVDSDRCSVRVENTGGDFSWVREWTSGPIISERNQDRLGIFTVSEEGTIITDRSVDGVYVSETSFYGGELQTTDPRADATITEKPSQIFFLAPEYYVGPMRADGKCVDENDENTWMPGDPGAPIECWARYPYFEWTGQTPSPLYSMAMHNYLAEIPNFFLKQKGFVTFASKPESEFKEMEEGMTYYMDVVLNKSDNFAMTLSPNNGIQCGNERIPADAVTTQGRYFGPSFMYKDASSYGNDFELIADPAQAPYTPPYFYGKATARLKFECKETRRYTVEEILRGIEVSSINREARDMFVELGGSMTSPAFEGMMTVSSSVNLFGKTRDKIMTHDVTTQIENQSEFLPTLASDPQNSNTERWVISPRMEVPVLNFYDDDHFGVMDCTNLGECSDTVEVEWRDVKLSRERREKLVSILLENIQESIFAGNSPYDITDMVKLSQAFFNSTGTDLNPATQDFFNLLWGFIPEGSEGDRLREELSRYRRDIVTPCGDWRNGRGTGMWSGYGKIPAIDEGVFLSLEESFKQRSDWRRPIFENTGSLADVCGFQVQTSRIGEIADNKEISEAVVMIPFVDQPSMTGAKTVTIGDRHFFKITKRLFNLVQNNVKKGDNAPALLAGQYGNEEDIQETSISRMIKLMKEYNIPPQLDFITYPLQRGEMPFVMYVHEFHHTLDKEDLINVWQGVMPKIARIAEKDTSVISHELGPVDFFEGKKLPKNVRWMVFKVKKKANTNYWKTTADSQDDDRFKFDFVVGKKDPEYSYNWPYDYFSLVELARIEGGLDIVPPPTKLSSEPISRVPDDRIEELTVQTQKASKPIDKVSTNVKNIFGWSEDD